MKKIIIAVLILLLPILCLAGALQEKQKAVIANKNVGGADTTPPTLSTATIGTNGTTWTFVFDETVSIGAGGNGGWAVSMSTQGAVTFTYSSGSGSNTLVYTGNKTVLSGETVTAGLDYTQPGDGIEDATGNDLVTIDDHAVTNNSTQGAPSYLLAEDCESGQNGWSTDTGTPNYAYDADPIVGTKSFTVGVSDTCGIWKDFSAPADPIYGFAKIKFIHYASTGNAIITMQAAENGDAYAQVCSTSSGTVFTVKCGTVEALTAVTPNETDIFSIWWSFSHAAQTASVWIAVNSETKPGEADATASGGNSGAGAAGMYVSGNNSYLQVVIDKIRIDDVAIGSDPI